MNDISCLENKIEEIIKKSSVSEDPLHSKNTMEWVLKLKPDADEALKISALGHDIERAVEERKVRRKDYKNYNEFKNAHASNSAKIMEEIMEKCSVDKKLIEDVSYLVYHHETGGIRRADILRNADTVSFFQVNLPYYFIRNGVEETKKRCLWGYKKLPDNLKEVVANFRYKDKEVEFLLRGIISFSDS
jgi:hypothetical protein